MTNIYSEMELETESDVEQKFIYNLLTNPEPQGLGFNDDDFVTKINIKRIKIDKGTKSKIYYPDYAIIIDGIPIAIIEAKAPGVLDDAYRQGRLYATEINSSYPSNINPCEYIVVTDGATLDVGKWDNDTPFLTLTNINLVSTDELFDHLLSVISKRSLQKRAKELLKNIKKTARYFKPKFMLGGKSVISETVGENSFGSNISIEYKYLFNPVSTKHRTEVVENAYITSKRKQSHVAPIDRIVRAAIPGQVNGAIEIGDTKCPTEIINRFQDESKLIHEVCLLIGSVGSGKSTFTDYLKVKALPEEIRNSTEWINVNLNDAPLSREMIYNWVIEQSIEKIKHNNPDIDFECITTLLEIYEDSISAVKKGKAALYPEDSEKYADVIFAELEKQQNDKIKTLQEIIKYIRNKTNKLLIIVLDNCDKGNRDDQLLMFEVASWLKRTFTCVIFLPLRDTTYDQYKNTAPLDTVIKDLVFRIDPPLLQSVIYSRLNYLTRELQSKNRTFHYNLPNGINVECGNDEVEQYIKSIIASLFQDPFFKRVIIGLAGRNIRKGLEIILDFCKSGHISEDEILKVRQSEGEYKLPSHIVYRILLKGKRKYYNDPDSYIRNMFHSEQDDELPDPFIRISILELLSQKYREYGPNGTKGFHKVGDILRILQSNGHASTRAFEEINILIDAGCIHSEAQNKKVTKDDLIAIAPSGLIHLELLTNINYLSAISEDTLFRENQVASLIKDNVIGIGRFKSDSWQTSLSNAKLITTYMHKYHAEYFLGNIKVLTENDQIKLNKMDDIFKYVNMKADSDGQFNKAEIFDDLYPVGSQIETQIVAIQHYGIFVEFGLNGTGLIHKSKLNNLTDIDTCEVGDWIVVEIIEFNTQHKKFDLELIKVL
jgi:hypothetical protein